jgi:hypothetical protein
VELDAHRTDANAYHFDNNGEHMVGANNRNKRSRTNWKRIDALQDSEIDFSEIPELGKDFFAQAIRWPDEKQQSDHVRRRSRSSDRRPTTDDRRRR